jgi:hypothetical protein
MLMSVLAASFDDAEICKDVASEELMVLSATALYG